MNNTPLWFLLLTALVAAGAAIGAQWVSAGLTSKHANQRSAQELNEARQRLVWELEHQRELERKKLLHDRRFELYQEAALLSFNFERVYVDYLRRSLTKKGSTDELHDEWQAKRSELSAAFPRLALVASSAVITAYMNLLHELKEVIDELFEKDRVTIHALKRIDSAHMSFVRHMRIDLDATEQLPEALKEASNRYITRYLFGEE